MWKKEAVQAQIEYSYAGVVQQAGRVIEQYPVDRQWVHGFVNHHANNRISPTALGSLHQDLLTRAMAASSLGLLEKPTPKDPSKQLRPVPDYLYCLHLLGRNLPVDQQLLLLARAETVWILDIERKVSRFEHQESPVPALAKNSGPKRAEHLENLLDLMRLHNAIYGHKTSLRELQSKTTQPR